ncbi:MAG: HXXEE domain-containing protein [Polyangia bacterium]
METILFGWPYAGLGLAALLLVWLGVEKRREGAPPRWQDPVFVLPLLWPMYLVHQFEEHGIDALGRHYAFLEGMCRSLGYAVSGCPADPAFIFAVNVPGGQVTFALAWLFRRRNPLVAACAWGVAFVNGVAHVGSALANQAYNPGTVTSLVLFAPLGALMLRSVLKSGAIRRIDVLRILASGIALHAVLMGSLLLRARGWLPHTALILVNATNGLWPLVFGWSGAKRTATAG